MFRRRLFSTLISVILVFIWLFSANSASAHPGRTDSGGGHNDKKNKSGLGSYHYHCSGNPPHLHTDGVCPYSDSISEDTAIPTKTVDGIEIPCYDFPVYKGSKSCAVEDVQNALIRLGYLDGTADGTFDEKTESAIIEYCEAFKTAISGSTHEAGMDSPEYCGCIDEYIYVCIMKDYALLPEDAA